MAGVALEPDVTGSAEAVVTLHHRKAALDGAADRGHHLVEPSLPRFQRLVPAGLVHHPIVDTRRGQLRPQCLRRIGLVAVNGLLVTLDQRRRRLAVVQVGRRQDRVADDLQPSSTAMCAL